MDLSKRLRGVLDTTPLLCALALTGCVASGTELNESQLASFHQGVTTEPEVRKALGRPQGFSSSTNGYRVLVYSGVHGSMFGAHATSVVFKFAPDGKLEQMTNSQSSSR